MSHSEENMKFFLCPSNPSAFVPDDLPNVITSPLHPTTGAFCFPRMSCSLTLQKSTHRWYQLKHSCSHNWHGWLTHRILLNFLLYMISVWLYIPHCICSCLNLLHSLTYWLPFLIQKVKWERMGTILFYCLIPRVQNTGNVFLKSMSKWMSNEVLFNRD